MAANNKTARAATDIARRLTVCPLLEVKRTLSFTLGMDIAPSGLRCLAALGAQLLRRYLGAWFGSSSASLTAETAAVSAAISHCAFGTHQSVFCIGQPFVRTWPSIVSLHPCR